jgi:hypothetical protein
MDRQIPTVGPHAFERDYPTPGAAEELHDSEEFHRAVEAYRFFYPTVSAEAIFNGPREAGLEDGKAMMVLAAGPRHVVFTANSDTPYASGVLDLRATGPVVIELPPGPFIALVNDHHQRWIVDMGIPGPDAGRGGRYLILPPGYERDVPFGYEVGRAQTHKVMVAVRALPTGGDTAGALAALRRVMIYPFGQRQSVLPYIDVTSRPLDTTPLRWEDNLEYWKRLHAILDDEPTAEDVRPLYGALAALGIRKGKPFPTDPRTHRILEAAAKAALEEMRVEAFASQRPDRLVWPDRRWEWVGLVPDDPNFETKEYLDLQARDRWFFQAIVASPAMFRRRVGVGSIYFLAARDATGAFLDGGKSYKLTVPAPVPAKLFWSVTAYDARTRSQVKTPQDKAVLGSLKDQFQPSASGTIDLHFGPEPPAGKGDAASWIQTSPGTGFFLYFRIYGPEAPSLDGSWKLGDLTPV